MWTFLAASFAISGVPPFSGYYSKDAILWMSYASPLGSPALWGLGVLGAGLTAFYIFRLFFLTFLGERRTDIPTWMHAHESPPVMTIPLVILAVLSTAAGWWADDLAAFLSPALHSSGVRPGAEEMETTLALVPVMSGAAGVILAAVFYLLVPSMPAKAVLLAGPLYRVLLRKYYVDEIYDAIIVGPLQRLSLWLWRVFDVRLIDGLVNRLGEAALLTSSSWRRIQTGNVQHYALGFLLGALLILAVMLGRS
jgi:NADH-quinone oxidoreductase subunit L